MAVHSVHSTEKETTVSERWDLVFKRDDLSVSEVRSASAPSLQPGEVSLAVEKFGLTANNAAYARFGDDVVIAFWNAFPGPEGWGRVPVWGVATVNESNHPDIAVGTRYWGYFPMSTHHVVQPQPAPGGFFDATSIRDFLHPWYRTYTLVDGDLDDRVALIRPVYPAAYNLADLVQRKVSEGARSLVVTSASSKVALGLVEELSSRNVDVSTVGVTSAANKGFVEGRRRYDSVVTYDDIASATAAGPVVFVDVTGSPTIRAAVCERFAADLVHTALCGFSHPDATVFPPPVAGPEPELFFTPAVEMETAAQEGAGYQDRYSKSEERFAQDTASWLTIEHRNGPAEIVAALQALLGGTQPPNQNLILHP
jgi:hypothetical protein